MWNDPCTVHKRYKAKRKPTVLCEQCWTKWVLTQVRNELDRLAILREARNG